jgi:hypothetical protein
MIQTNSSLGLKGRVTIHSIDELGYKKLEVDTHNLVVYTGRAWLLPMLFNIANPSISTGLGLGIYWISFGSGGAPSNNLFSPIPPSSTDTSITTVTINANDTNLANSGTMMPVNNSSYSSSVTYQQDPNLGNQYLIAQVSALLSQTQANNNYINEAALWISNSNNASSATTFAMFAHVTFPSLYKTSSIQLVFNWYVHS